MLEYVEARPGLAALVVFGMGLALVVEWLVRRQRGTWVPIRLRPFKRGPVLRWASVVVMVLVAALGIWQTVEGVRVDRPGVAIVGAGLAAFSTWVAWVGSVRGRDVEEGPQT